MFRLPFPLPWPKLSDWKDFDELQRFLERDKKKDHPISLVADKNGILRFDNRCEVFVQQMIERAERRGKRLHFVPLSSDEYYKWHRFRIRNYHAVCGATVGTNDFYYIDAQTYDYLLAIHFE